MIVSESLAFDALIGIGDLSNANSNFRQFTNHIFDVLRKELGIKDAVEMLEMEDELKSMYDQGFTGLQTIETLKKLDIQGYDFKSKSFNQAKFVHEELTHFPS